jgi:hypothetical protein
MGITPNRLVAVLTPLVFAPLAGTVSVLVAKYLPGLDIESGQLQQIFIAGALIAFGKAGLWLKGWQDWEKSQSAVPEDVVNDVALAASPDVAAGDPDDHYDPALADADPDMDPGYEDDDADYGGSPAYENGLAAAWRD